ncbi:MAG: proline racemase family protein [Micrococcaceae bacterium]
MNAAKSSRSSGEVKEIKSSSSAFTVETEDYHTVGEPFRIVTNPPVAIPGKTVKDKREAALSTPEIDNIRKLMCLEPRGHADMYGGLIVPPDDEDAHFGVLFWDRHGFSTACGHGTIALGTWAVNSGLVEMDPSGITDVVIDVPSGRVTASVHTDKDGRVEEVDFVNVPSRFVGDNVILKTSECACKATLGWGGALYVGIEAKQFGLTVTPKNLTKLIELSQEIKVALKNDSRTEHPSDSRLSGVYGVIFFEDFGTLPTGELHQRNVTIFADGQVDRSPCGSGSSSRMAVLNATGKLNDSQVFLHDSIIGSRFEGRILKKTTEYNQPAIIPKITGNAYKIGHATFEVDSNDPITPGFLL